MAGFQYSRKIGENEVRAVGRSLSISTKQSVEICRTLRKKNIHRAKRMLEDAIQMKRAIPFKRFNRDVGHKKGRMAGGRYAVNACTAILKLINTAEANAQFKGLPTSNLIISHISAHMSGATWRYGRRQRRAKRTSVEIILEEGAKKEKKAKGTREPKPKKTAAKPAANTDKKEVKFEKKEKKSEAPKEEKKEGKKEPVKAEEKKEEVKEEPKLEKKETPKTEKGADQ